MIKIDFTEPSDDSWKEWVEKCRVKTEWHIIKVANGENPKITALYKHEVIHEVLFSVDGPFHGKCVYCEALITTDQHGDVEHFRPKNGLTDSNNQPVIVDDGNGNDIQHPGYYWLAYDWHNLLPSCALCNQPNKQSVDGMLVSFGKWNKFPVRDYLATKPGQEVHEEALLINPVTENPKDHLDIDETGILSAKTDEGQTCIDVFGLNARPGIVDERKRTFKDVKDKIKMLVICLNDGKLKEVASRTQELLAIRNGKQPYSAAAHVAIGDMEKKLRS